MVIKIPSHRGWAARHLSHFNQRRAAQFYLEDDFHYHNVVPLGLKKSLVKFKLTHYQSLNYFLLPSPSNYQNYARFKIWWNISRKSGADESIGFPDR
jgi:hypothetical protein